MDFYHCSGCGIEFIYRRGLCPNCHSREFVTAMVSEGIVLESVRLIATPDPFPDQYSIIMFKTSGGARGFCRTSEELDAGTEITLEEDEFGPVCYRK